MKYTGTSQEFPTGEEKVEYRGNKKPAVEAPEEEVNEVKNEVNEVIAAPSEQIEKSDLPEEAKRNRLMKLRSKVLDSFRSKK